MTKSQVYPWKFCRDAPWTLSAFPPFPGQVAARHHGYLEEKGLLDINAVPSDLGLIFRDTDPESSDSELGDLLT